METDSYHQKRKTLRRNDDHKLEFLIKICERSVRINDLVNLQDFLKNGLDTVRNWDEAMKREII